jgi:hypothetical protein
MKLVPLISSMGIRVEAIDMLGTCLKMMNFLRPDLQY